MNRDYKSTMQMPSGAAKEWKGSNTPIWTGVDDPKAMYEH